MTVIWTPRKKPGSVTWADIVGKTWLNFLNTAWSSFIIKWTKRVKP